MATARKSRRPAKSARKRISKRKAPRTAARRVLSDRSKYPRTAPLTSFARQYIDSALWSSTDNADESGGRPLDDNYSINDIAPATLARMKRDAAAFLRDNADDIGYGAKDRERAAHDFWLSRNGHGTGFWDNEDVYGVAEARRLHSAAKSFGEYDLYVGDDGMIHGSGTQHTRRSPRSRRAALKRRRRA